MVGKLIQRKNRKFIVDIKFIEKIYTNEKITLIAFILLSVIHCYTQEINQLESFPFSGKYKPDIMILGVYHFANPELDEHKSPDIDMLTEQKQKEIDILLDKIQKLWDKNLYGHLLLINPETHEIYVNMPDSANELKLINGIYEGNYPKNKNFANTSVHWNGDNWASERISETIHYR